MKEVTWQVEFSTANLSPLLRSNVRLVYTTPGEFENRGYQIMFYVHNTPEKTRQSSVILEHKLLSFLAVVALWTLVTLLIKWKIKWKYTQTEIMPFWPLCCESEAVLSKKFRRGYPGWSVYMGESSSQLLRFRSQKPRSR